jgi:tetratricopeptide (TPR) repeat protein/TolB-like protein/DNA-binding winged helix-turn-helix (wHTH) protein
LAQGPQETGLARHIARLCYHSGNVTCRGGYVDSDLLHGFYLKNLLVEPLKGQVVRDGKQIHLPPKAMEVLLSLASNPTRLVTRESIMERVWGAGQGSQDALGRAVSEIRNALGDQVENPQFIQTLPRRGYRLIVAPNPVTTAADKINPAASTALVDELGFFDNLKQRGVFEAAIAYLVSGWLIIQVADIVFDQLHLPAWAGTFVTALVIAGFPIVIALSWFLEFRDGRAVLDQSSHIDARRRQFSRTYLSVIAALVIAAVGVYVYDSSIGLPQPPAPEAAAVEVVKLPPVLDNSIAVLPFLNLDGSEETQIFSNGLVDDVITRLSHVPGLLVSSRGDAFTLEPNSASSKVRERLRVALYVEGSVQIVDDRMRIIVQLIDSATGFHVLSRSFDRLREDFFDIRDEITRLTVANVRVALPPATRDAAEGLSNDPSLDVYVLYRRGVETSLLPRSTETLRKALEWFDAALEQDSDYAAAHAGKCGAYVWLYPETDDSRYIGEAEASCARALQLNPNLDVVHAALGELYSATGKYEQAESAYLAALEIDPNSVASLTGLANIYQLQRKPDEAEERYRQAIGRHPGDWSAYNALGYFLYRSGRYAEAAKEYEYVVALDPRNSPSWNNLGAAYMLAGNFESALRTYQRALEIAPTQTTYANLGLMYYYLGRTDEAVVAQRKSVELAPNDHLAWSNLGDALWMSNQEAASHAAFQKAEKLANAALEVNPNDPTYLMDLAWISAVLDRPREARILIDRALAAAPDDPYGHYYSGLIRLRAGDSEGALDDFQAALDRGYPVKLLIQDPQLESIRTKQRFRSLVEPRNSG